MISHPSSIDNHCDKVTNAVNETRTNVNEDLVVLFSQIRRRFRLIITDNCTIFNII